MALSPEMLRAMTDALRGGHPVVSVVVVEGKADSDDSGRRMLVSDAGTLGTLGSPILDARAVALARERFEDPATIELSVGGRTYILYVEPHRPPAELVIIGAGHIARPLCRIGALLGFRVVVLDDRPAFATPERFPEAERVLRADFHAPLGDVRLGSTTHLVLVTRGHRHDYEVLREVLRLPERPAYIGMVGSRRRVRATLEQLHREEIPSERLDEIYAPIGLDIGAQTPEEIAISIAAELIRVRRGGSGASLRERERVRERWIREQEE